MKNVIHFICDILSKMGVTDGNLEFLTAIVSASLTLIVAWGIYMLLSRVVGRYLTRLVEYTEVKWDDVVFNPRVLQGAWQLLLSHMLYATLPACFAAYEGMEMFLHGLCKIIVVISWVVLIVRVLSALFELLSSVDRFAENSFKGICQLFQLLTICGGIIIIVSIMIGRDPVFVLSGLGAIAAVLMLVFQDTILGFVAGIQLTANDMLRPGDWITAPKSNANGIVIDVNLTTVKVQNFDMTIVTIPPYTLVRDSFQNWRGMRDSGGRRIMRSFNIDMTCIRHATPDEIERFSAEPWWNPEYAPGGVAVNLTLFRRYLTWFIKNQPETNTGMTAMVRELQPTPEGLPIEIYLFSREKEWTLYETIQADLLDRILATVDRFGLRVFQRLGSLEPTQRR